METNNKQIAKLYFWLGLWTLISLSFISCEDETEENKPDYELIIPSNAYSFALTSIDNENGTTIHVEPSFTKNFEVLGCSVNKISYYIDNTLVSTETSSPFYLDYKTNLLSKGQHVLKAEFTVGGNGFRDKMIEDFREFAVGGNASARPAVKFNFEYDRYLRVDDNVHISINMFDRYNVGYKLHKVEYYFDNSLISTKTNAPYDFDYSPTLVVGKQYPLRVNITYTIGGSYFSSYGLISDITVLADDETRYLFSPDFFDNTYFNNGESISGTGLLYRGVGDDMVYELNLYWDDELVGTSTSFPYKFSHVIENASKGTHKVKYEWKRYDKRGNYIGQSQTRNIIIDN